jgi:hypothetical protein
MAGDCCKLVGNYPIGDGLGCVISVNVSSSTDTTKIGDCVVVGPTVGTVSMTGYATENTIHVGCHGKAGVSIPWIRKYDCDNDEVHFLFSGGGKAYTAGDVEGLASLNETVAIYRVVNASSSSGPASLYMNEVQNDGYGLNYIGLPLSFSTNNENDVVFQNNVATGLGLPAMTLYLQSFSVDFVPGQLPVASYSFVFTISN